MMSEKKNTLGKAVAVAAGVGAAYLALKKKENEKQVLEQQAAQNSNYTKMWYNIHIRRVAPFRLWDRTRL